MIFDLYALAETAYTPLPERDLWNLSKRQLAVDQMEVWGKHMNEISRSCVELRKPGDCRVRLGVKDTLDVSGWPTRLGLPEMTHLGVDSVPAIGGFPTDSIVAKTTTTELGIGLEHGCVNIAYPHLDPGGSSTGSAVAVANGVCDIALGTDSVASVRLPAAACGVVGLRTSGRVGELHPGFTLSQKLDAAGWFSRTPEDLAWAWVQWIEKGTAIPAEIRGLRVGIICEAMNEVIDSDMGLAVILSTEALQKSGAVIAEVKLGRLYHHRSLAYTVCSADAYRTVRMKPDLFGQLSRSTQIALSGASDQDMCSVESLMEDCRVEARYLLRDGSFWILPSGSQHPLDLRCETRPESTIPSESAIAATVNYAAMAAFLGLPSISVPIKGDDPDMPLSLQIVGPPGSDAVLISLSCHIARYLALPELCTLTTMHYQTLKEPS